MKAPRSKVKVKGVDHVATIDPFFQASSVVVDTVSSWVRGGLHYTNYSVTNQLTHHLNTGFWAATYCTEIYLMEGALKNSSWGPDYIKGIAFGGHFKVNTVGTVSDSWVHWEWFISQDGRWTASKNGRKVK